MSIKLQGSNDYLIGVISDTHGLLRPEVLKSLKGVDLIIHAGDIDNPEILETLRASAPVIAVRGNMDKNKWAHDLPETEIVEIGEVKLFVLHDVHKLDLKPEISGFDAVISGHSHLLSIEKKNGVLYINPGSAGPKRLNLPVTIVLLHVNGGSLEAEVVELKT